MTDPLRVARALVDEVRLLPEESREAVLQGARLRRDALALAAAQTPPSAAAVGAMIERFRRARGLLRAADLDAWLADRASHREDFARWIRDEAALQSVGMSAAHLAPRDVSDFARVAEGTDALWSRARAVAAARPGTRTADECVQRYFASLGRTVPDDLDGWAARAGFEGRDDALAAIERHVTATDPVAVQEDTRASVGDPAPDFALTHPAAGVVRGQDLAGQTVVLALAPDAATARALRDRWDASPVATALVIARDAGADGAKVPWLHDGAGVVAARFGLAPDRASHVVLDASLRVRWIGEDPAAAEREALALDAIATTTSAVAPVLLVRDVFDAEECATLVARWRDHGHDAGAVTANTAGGVGTYADATIKRRSDHVVTDASLDATIRARLARRVYPELLRAFHFIVGGAEAFRIGRYDAADAGHFRAHRDDENPAVAHRRFAFTMHLEDPSRWEGGDLRLPEYGASLRPPRGAAVVYSASVLHEVTPVTRGSRFVLVGFFSGSFR